MPFIFSNVPVDIIVYLGKFLDYDSIINLNRTMQPSDRLVRRKFTKNEVNSHESQAIAQGKKNVLEKFNYIYDLSLKRMVQKKCKNLLEILRSFRKNTRAFHIVKRNSALRNIIVSKCKDVLLSGEDRRIFGGTLTTYYRIKLTREARGLIEEINEIMPLNINEASKPIII
jgi:hypothetical protein